MHNPDHDAAPLNPVPPVVWLLAALLAGPELVFQAGARGFAGGPEGIGWRNEALQTFGFFDAVFEQMRTTGVWPLDGLWRFVTYIFVHQNLLHTLIAIVLLLAMGNYTARLFHPAALILIFFASAILGALAYGLVLTYRFPLYGAYPAVYGLIGVYTWSLWVMAEKLGKNPYGAFRLIGILVGLQIIFSLISGFWQTIPAEVAGFATGFALAAPAAPGGLMRLRRKLQGR
ncbi:MAG: rhomboid family intramembrane serine protease [Pseudomonadota bacterium]